MNSGNLSDTLQYINLLNYQQNLMNLSALLNMQRDNIYEKAGNRQGKGDVNYNLGSTQMDNARVTSFNANSSTVHRNEGSKGSTTSDNDKGRKYYHCIFPGCTKKFTANYNRKIHYRLHTGERPFSCKLCSRNYYDRANYKYHVRTAHKAVPEKEKCCSHLNCIQNFKSKKQKLVHHEKLEPECHKEKNLLLNLLIKYKETLKGLVDTNKIDEFLLADSCEYKMICDEIEKAPKYVGDLESFCSVMGERYLN